MQCVMPLHSFLSMSNWLMGGAAGLISSMPTRYLLAVSCCIFSFSTLTVSIIYRIELETPSNFLAPTLRSWYSTKFLTTSSIDTLFYIVCNSIIRNWSKTSRNIRVDELEFSMKWRTDSGEEPNDLGKICCIMLTWLSMCSR